MNKLRYSAVESARFGYEIFRANADISPDLLVDLPNDVDILIVRDREVRIHSLYQKMRAFADVHFRDTILSFSKRLIPATMMTPMRLECEIRPLEGKDWQFVGALMQKVFQDYPGHYQRGFFFEKSHSAAGMHDWLRKLMEQVENRVFSILLDGNPIGVIGYEVHGATFELALAAVDPVAGLKRRNLLLLEAVRRAELLFLENGMRFFVAKTQAANLAVQKNLVRYVNCEPDQSLSTLHVHFFLKQIREQGTVLPIAGDFHATVFGYARSLAPDNRMGPWTFTMVPNGPVSTVKVVRIRRTDSTGAALFFLGKDEVDRITAHASVYLRY